MKKISFALVAFACVCTLMLANAKILPAVEETGGIGLKVGQLYNYSSSAVDKRGSIVVLDVFRGSPAHRHGIQKGDIILKVDGVVTKQSDFKTILDDHLRGPSFTEVTLTIWRPSTQEKFEVTNAASTYGLLENNCCPPKYSERCINQYRINTTHLPYGCCPYQRCICLNRLL